MSVSIENFVKAIYKLQYDGGEPAHPSKLAAMLGVSNAAITDMARKLNQQKLISYQKYKAIELTEDGKTLALKVIRRHRLWEAFLVEVLEIPWEKVHSEAERLEHETSDFLADEIDRYLGFPTHDPHGGPIPNIKLEVPKIDESQAISLCEEKGIYRIVRITPRSQDMANYFAKQEIALYKEILFEIDEVDNKKSITLQNRIIKLTNEIANHIHVVKI